MPVSGETVSEVLATLLRISERLEALERVQRAQLEHSREVEGRYRRIFAALAMVAGHDGVHDD